MKTVKQYQADVSLRTHDSRLLSFIDNPEEMIRLGAQNQKNTFLLLLEETIFFPEGGGQPCDTGFIDGYPVFYVFERDGLIYHQLSTPTSNLSLFLEKASQGVAVHCEIDWNRRFLHMQMHCGEHILSGVFYQEYGGVNRGFHMGDDYMTIDISLEENPEHSQFTQEMIDRVERLANEIIWENVPVITRHFIDKKDAEGLALRKPLAIDEDITIVCVGNPSPAAHCVACCGTHPNTTGQVGFVKIIKAEAYKGMTRFHAKAGRAAFEDYAIKHRVISTLCKRHSSEPKQLLEKINIQEDKNGGIRKELYDLKKNIIEQQVVDIEQIYQTTTFEQKTPIVIKRYNTLNVDDLQTLGRRVTPAVKGLLLLISEKETTVLLVSQGQPDCGRLVRENAAIYQGKGGGNNNLARAIFTKPENLDTYLDLLEKHLR